MNFSAQTDSSAVAPPSIVRIERKAASSARFSGSGSGTATEDPTLAVVDGDLAELKLASAPYFGELDWSKPKLTREFVRLEQTVLARKASEDEIRRYRALRSDRNSIIFAKRALRDYAEIQRIRKLNQKLAELEQYLRPIEL